MRLRNHYNLGCFDSMLVFIATALIFSIIDLSNWLNPTTGTVSNHVVFAAAAAAKTADDNDNYKDDMDCPLWLAPSYSGTEKEPKYGLYAGKNYMINETFNKFAELAVPLIDFVEISELNIHENNNNDKGILHNKRQTIVELIENHLWTAEFVGTKWEGNHSAPVAIPGVGVLANYHSAVANVDFLQSSVLLRRRESYTKPGLKHPSRGAITPYYNVTIRATQNIPPGMELFADFGDVWDGNYTDDMYQDKISRFDYQEADKIVDVLVNFFDNVTEEENNPSLPLELQDDIMDFMLDKVLGMAAGKHAKTIRSLIPDNPRKLKRVQQMGGTFMYRYSDMVRSTEWLQGNGFCLDTIRSGTSTIPEAGRGAFATRKIRQGSTITISPLLHIADKEVLDMYPTGTDADQKGRTATTTTTDTTPKNRPVKPMGKQLLLNYCFGHPESSLLLFPLGNLVTLINHSSKRPNAYVTWAKSVDKGLSNQHKYHDYTVEQLVDVDRVVLVMKVVALRDIEDGEEILIDYGPEWQRAWDDYHIRWEMTNEMKPQHLLKAEDMREMYRTKPFETPLSLSSSSSSSSARRTNPYPPGVATACYLRSQTRPDGYPMVDIQNGLQITEFIEPILPYQYQGSHLFIVDVLDRTPVPSNTSDDSNVVYYNYTVNARVNRERVEQVVNVPHSACTFIDVPYKSDIHIKNAFRHPIGFMDGHFPQAWRNLR